jgi:hypothetical protein
MANKVLLKKSAVAARVPAVEDLDYGELALNYADGKLYFKNSSNGIEFLGSSSAIETLSNKTLTSPTANNLEINVVTQQAGIQLNSAGAIQPTFILKNTVSNFAGGFRLVGGVSEIFQFGGGQAGTSLGAMQFGTDVFGNANNSYLDIGTTAFTFNKGSVNFAPLGTSTSFGSPFSSPQVTLQLSKFTGGVTTTSGFRMQAQFDTATATNVLLYDNPDSEPFAPSSPNNIIKYSMQNTQLQVLNINDGLGLEYMSTYGAGYMGLATMSEAKGVIPANSYRNFFAINSADGAVGSVTPVQIGPPKFRNKLDDGSGNLIVGGDVTTINTTRYLQVAHTTPSTSTTTGALQVAGGAGIAGALNVGLNATINGVSIGKGASNISQNLAFGPSALSNPSTSATELTAIGNETMQGLVTGNYNTAIGSRALRALTGGTVNTAIGNSSLAALTTGFQNVSIGDQAGGLLQTGSNNIFIGNNAGKLINNGIDWVKFNTKCIYIGNSTKSALENANNEIVIGFEAQGLGNNKTVIGNSATIATKLFGTLETVGDATINGIKVGLGPGTGNSTNTAVGLTALNANTSGADNTAIGYLALNVNTTSSFNTALGAWALRLATGARNTALGRTALYNQTTASDNIAVGYFCGENITSGGANVLIGSSAFNNATTGINNVAIGHQAARFLTDGTTSLNSSTGIYIGQGVRGGTAATETNAIVIGAGALGLGSDTTVIGNSSTTKTKLFGALETTGDITVKAGSSTGSATITTPTTELVLSETGDQFGTSTLRIQNRNGMNGALFDNSASSIGCVDFGFKTRANSVDYQQLFRYEVRTAARSISIGSAGEFQVMGAAGLCANTNQTYVVPTTASTSTTTGALRVGGGAGIAGNLYVGGNLVVNGSTTTINSNTVSVDDKNIELGGVVSTSPTGTVTAGSAVITALTSTANIIPGSEVTALTGAGTITLPAGTTVASIDSATQITLSAALTGTGGPTTLVTLTITGATDVTANGGGITLKGTTDKTISWSTLGWTSSEDFNLASGKVYEINGTSVLSATTLGSGVTASSLTSLGTIASLSAGTINGSTAFQLGTVGANGNIKWNNSGLDSWFGVYNANTSLHYGISTRMPSPAGTSTLGGYYSGLAIGGSSNNTGQPIFGVCPSGVGTPGLGGIYLTVYDDKRVFTFANTLDDGSGNMIVTGDLTVNGTTTTINSTTLTVDDKNIELGSVATPTDATAEGGGITLRGAPDKTIKWGTTVGWTSSEDFNLAPGKIFKVNNVGVISSNSLGSGVVSSSLTSLGTITTLNAGTGTFTPNTSGVSTGLNVVNGDITTYRAGGTTGVIYLTNSGTKYLYYDGTNYVLNGAPVVASNITAAGNVSGSSASTTVLNQAGTFPTANDQDFNNITTPGFWNITWGNYSGTLNAPVNAVNSYGTLIVVVGQDFRTQIYYPYAANSSPLHRTFYNGNWQPWVVGLTSANYNSYSPTLTGTGASGSWDISVTGNAATATSAATLTTARTINGVSFNGSANITIPITVTTSETAPVSPAAGALWWDSSSGALKIYYTDADTSQWVDASAGGGSSGTITEVVFPVTGTTPAISPSNGTIQTWTLTGASTPTAGTWAQGQSLTLMVNDTASVYTVTWTSLGVVWVGGSAPALTPGAGYTVIELWKVGSTIYGALVGQVA